MTDRHDAYYARKQAHRAEMFDLALLGAFLKEHADCWPAAAIAAGALFFALLGAA